MKYAFGFFALLPLTLHLNSQAPFSDNGKPTADELLSKIKSHLTCDWNETTVDTYKGGNGTMSVTGIATTFLATMDVLKKAKAKGLNFIITHEPTFYNHFDHTESFEGDAVFEAKKKFIEDNGMIVWRFHDHWHRTTPDGIYMGVVDKMNWQSFEISQRPYVYKLPKTTVTALGNQLKAIFKTNTIRVVGDPDLEITHVGMVLGAAGSNAQIACLQRPEVEALIIGETHEWETVEYVRDAVSQGKSKVLFIIGHANSEEAGMSYCADWLKSFVSEVPIEFIPAGDPFWTPGG